MKPITRDILTYENGRDEIGWTAGGFRRSAQPSHDVCSYTELLRKVAALAYYNNTYALLFRGQPKDYMLNVDGEAGIHSHLYPSIYRTVPGIGKASVDMKFVYERRFSILAKAERKLKEIARIGDIHRDQTLRWALLQHYEVCPTPLLDVTSSLQIALSFSAEKSKDNPILYVLAVPHLTGVVSISFDAGTQVVSLSQICPPEALRPHFQEASLMGSYPRLETEDFLRNPHGTLYLNFAGRLLAKFRLNGLNSWSESGFQPTIAHVIRPDHEDTYFTIMAEVASGVRQELDELQKWEGRDKSGIVGIC